MTLIQIRESFDDLKGYVFFCPGISGVLFHTLGFSRCHNTFLSTHHRPCSLFVCSLS